MPTISDRVWQCLFRFGLEPAHEASFSARNIGFRVGSSVYDVQRIFFYNLASQSFGFQKRVLLIKLDDKFTYFNCNFLLRKLFVPRSLKLAVFRFFKMGFFPAFLSEFIDSFYLDSLLANILLDGLENLHSSVRVGVEMAFFLKPNQDEKRVIDKIFSYLNNLMLDLKLLRFCIFNAFEGFDFLGWHFKVCDNNSLVCVPSYLNYQQFLLRVKHILNNSNYGVVGIRY